MLGLPAMMLTVVVFSACGIVAAASVWSGRHDVLAKVVKVSLVWAAAYASLLISVAANSDQVVLEPGSRKTFCGAYIDCHLGVSVIESWRSSRVIFDNVTWSSDGEYLFVDVEVSSDAIKAPMHLRNPRLVVVADDGTRYERVKPLEHKIASQLGQPHSLSSSLQPSGTITKTLVFDVPQDAGNLRLHAINGEFGERFVELFLIGDEDSLFHKPVLLRLESSNS